MIDARAVDSKKGIVPKPKDDYKAGSVQVPEWNEGKKGWNENTEETIAPATQQPGAEPSAPSMGVTSRKSAAHAQSYPGIEHPTVSTPKAVEAKPVSRDVVNKQLGSNRRLGN